MKLRTGVPLLSAFLTLSASAEFRDVSTSIPEEIDIPIEELVPGENLHFHGEKYKCISQFGTLHPYSAAGVFSERENVKELQRQALKECRKAHPDEKHRCHDRGCLILD